MTSPTQAALRLLADELGADAAVLARHDGPASTVVSVSTIDAVREGDPWPPPPSDSSESMLDMLVTDPSRFPGLLTTAVRLGLPAPVRAVLTTSLVGGDLRLILAWAQSEPPERAVDLASTAAWGVFTTLAPLLDTQRMAEQTTARFRAVLGAMSQAVVLFDNSGGPGEVNAAAARLLGVDEGSVPAEQLSGGVCPEFG